MMTFIVVGDFVLNATLLDSIRLSKQRIEAKQIVDVIIKGSGGWANHPIVKAWRPYLNALKYYANCIIKEHIRRGYKNSIELYKLPKIVIKPWWSHWDRLHQSHRAMLFRKNPFYYEGKFDIQEEFLRYGYIWPHDIDYKNRNDPLESITAEIPDNLIDPKYCPALIKSGSRAGESCNRLLKKGRKFCGTHDK